jgi:hypothetical protein
MAEIDDQKPKKLSLFATLAGPTIVSPAGTLEVLLCDLAGSSQAHRHELRTGQNP